MCLDKKASNFAGIGGLISGSGAGLLTGYGVVTSVAEVTTVAVASGAALVGSVGVLVGGVAGIGIYHASKYFF